MLCTITWPRCKRRPGARGWGGGYNRTEHARGGEVAQRTHRCGERRCRGPARARRAGGVYRVYASAEVGWGRN